MAHTARHDPGKREGTMGETILIIEDNETLREAIVHIISGMGHRALAAPNGKLGLEVFRSERPDVILSDLKMDVMGGMEVLGHIMAEDAHALVIIITAFGSIERAVDAMRAGAFDFLAKPFPSDLLRAKIERALETKRERARSERLVQENEMLRAEAKQSYDSGSIVGDSEAMRAVFATVDKVGASDSTVYVYGESGTGKELVARALHDRSRRAEGPFIKVNCSALAESLLES